MISKSSVKVFSRLTRHEQKYFYRLAETLSTTVNTQSTPEPITAIEPEKIVIPKRIKRTSIDILKALSQTVGRDPTAPHYMFYDDPYLYPNTHKEKMMYGLSRESGAKTAHWVIEQQSHLFKHTPDDPVIEKFLPKSVYNETSEVSENILKDLISTFRVEDSITVYQLCTDKNIELKDEVKQDLLELVCFYNCEDQSSEDYPISRWYRDKEDVEGSVNTWKVGNFAEELFSSMETPSTAAYCAMICGLVKYNSIDKAWGLYHETKVKNMTLDTTTYNALIKICNIVKASADSVEKKDETIGLLSEMAENEVSPNVYTLDSVLEALYTLPMKERDQATVKALAEFERIGIKPNLSTYSWIIMNCCYKRNGNSNVVKHILERLPPQKIEMQDVNDSEFFPLIIASAARYNDWKSVVAIDELLNCEDNFKFLNLERLESIYYTYLLSITSRLQPPEVFMELFRSSVPSVVSPNANLYMNFIKNLSQHGGYEHIPEIMSHNISTSSRILDSLLTAISKFRPEDYEADVLDNYNTILTTLWQNVVKDYKSSKTYRPLEPEFLDGFVKAALKCCKLSHINDMVKYLQSDPDFCLGTVDPILLRAIVEKATEDNNFVLAFNTISLWQNYGYPDIQPICEIAEKMEKLTPLDKSKLQSFYIKDKKSE